MSGERRPGRDASGVGSAERVSPAGRPAVAPALRRPLAVTAALAALVLAVLGVVVGGSSVGLPLDAGVSAAVATAWPDPYGGSLALLIDFCGDPRAVAVAVAVLAAGCLALGRRRLAVLAVAAPVLTGLLTTGLKPVVDRTIHGDNLSYPSGHTASSVAIALVVALLLVDLLRTGPVVDLLVIAVLAVVAGATMGFTQVALDAHYPTDTVGGAAAAVVAVVASALLIDRVSDR
jgi:membrane-associated phospholipid phosphatase